MANTLGIHDDEALNLVRDIEKAFDVNIGKESESILTVGQLHDLLLRKIPLRDTDKKCASAVAFYRLKQGIKTLGLDVQAAPSADLRQLEINGAKNSLRALEKETGLRLPEPGFTRLGLFGLYTSLFSFFAFAGFSIYHPLDFWHLILVVIFLAGITIARLTPGKLPKSCSTLGKLAEKTAALNYGDLIKLGASHSDKQIWKNLVALLQNDILSASEITRDTFFSQSQLSKKISRHALN